MNVWTYLCFTIFSILTQFVIMDILYENKSHREQFHDLLSGFDKPQTMHYQSIQSVPFSTTHGNSTIQPMLYEETSTTTATILDVFYDVNISITEETSTTDVNINSSTESFNTTEFSIYPNSSFSSTEKPDPNEIKKAKKSSSCYCNLLYKVCDINCCCDEDCTTGEQNLFHCNEQDMHIKGSQTCSLKTSNRTYPFFLDNLFCVVKTNIPDKRKIVKYSEGMDIKVESVIPKFLAWQHNSKTKSTIEFPMKSYAYNDPVWVIHNETVSTIDLPIPEINNYCSGRTPVSYLKDTEYKCLVKVQELEIFNIYHKLINTHIISVTDKRDNISPKNCSNLYCTPWEIIVCDEVCHSYNSTLDEPSCSEHICTNIVLKIEYIFYCRDSKIKNGTIRLHKQSILFKTMFIEQEIKVKFYLIKDNQKNIVQFSGNPGYLDGLPVIASFKEVNFTHNFFQNSELDNIITHPANVGGYCTLTNLTYKKVRFGFNKQNKCRLPLDSIYSITRNATENCQSIQKHIYDLIKINKPIYVSPFGNPTNLEDSDWIEIEYDVEKGLIYGQLKDNNSKLGCYNMVIKFSYVFTYADFGKEEIQQKIMDAKAFLKIQDLTVLSIDDLSVIVTVETGFFDVTKPPVYQYAGGPRLDVHLPEDFFMPFAPNAAYSNVNVAMFVMVCFAHVEIL